MADCVTDGVSSPTVVASPNFLPRPAKSTGVWARCHPSSSRRGESRCAVPSRVPRSERCQFGHGASSCHSLAAPSRPSLRSCHPRAAALACDPWVYHPSWDESRSYHSHRGCPASCPCPHASCDMPTASRGEGGAKTSRAAQRGGFQRGWSQKGEILNMRYRTLPKVVAETRAP